MTPSLPWRRLRSGSAKLKRRLPRPRPSARASASPPGSDGWAVTCARRCGRWARPKKSLSSMAKGSAEKSCAPLAAAAYRAVSTSRRAAINRAVRGSAVSKAPHTQQASCTRKRSRGPPLPAAWHSTSSPSSSVSSGGSPGLRPGKCMGAPCKDEQHVAPPSGLLGRVVLLPHQRHGSPACCLHHIVSWGQVAPLEGHRLGAGERSLAFQAHQPVADPLQLAQLGLDHLGQVGEHQRVAGARRRHRRSRAVSAVGVVCGWYLQLSVATCTGQATSYQLQAKRVCCRGALASRRPASSAAATRARR
eukprot:scaffold100225_cov62-Phaeocystis_antarctica.AAC.6